MLANGNIARAETLLKPVQTALPNAAPVLTAAGAVALAKHDLGAARRAFARAEQVDATNFEALSGLVAVDFAEKKPDAAVARVEQQLSKTPDDARLHVLAARVFLTSGDKAKGEQHLRATIEKDPSNLQAYAMLAGLYAAEKRLAEARQSLETIVAKRPNAVGAMTLIAMLYQVEGNQAEARKRYERIMQVDPRAAVAANNLAYIYAEEGGNLDVALQLAQTAKQQLPDNPQVNDTLGWVYARKGLGSLAQPLLEEAQRANDRNPKVAYHLGVVYAAAGEQQKAASMFNKSLALRASGPEADEVKKALEALQKPARPESAS